ncbi:MAG: non-homologous end-joining DNA ligase, partial [Acidimicrobiia bacterium]
VGMTAGDLLEPDVDPLTAPVGAEFVIQQHHATRLHHDVRLEMMSGDGPVLVSWAVPKGLPRRRGDRHLAIRTPDHEMEWGSFSGSIGEEEYGGGEVRIFDHGEYELVGRTEDRLTFQLKGERLAGVWHLVHTGPKDGKDQWLALMSEDLRPKEEGRPPAKPMLATLTAEAFDDAQWGFEPKWDGIRAIAMCDEETHLLTRNDKDVTVAYPELRRLHEQTVALEAMLDGEIVAFDKGVPSFQRLQQRMHLRDERKIEEIARQIPVVYLVFDVLYIDGEDLTDQPLEERRRILDESIVPSDRIQVSPVTQGKGKALYKAAEKQGLEGIMAKRLSSVYQPGERSKDWLKVKVTFDADVVIVGWTEGEGSRVGSLGSLMMAVYDDGVLRYVGNVGTGFKTRSLPDIFDQLKALTETMPPFPTRPELRRAHWVKPSLVAVVEHRGVTSAGRLRSPSFQRFRDDKKPKECTFDLLSPG